MAHYVTIDGVDYEVTGGIVAINNVDYPLERGLTTINGVDYPIEFGKTGTPIGDLIVGETVWMNVNGTPYEWIIVHQGKPSDIYDDSCNGTWMLMKDIYERRAWHSSDVNDYENSTIHSYLNSTFLGLLDANIQSAIKQVKIPYRKGSGVSHTITSGASGLAAKIFLMSGAELNWTSSNSSYITNDGACLSYFSGCAEIDSKRIANLNGSAGSWKLRSPSCSYLIGSTSALGVKTDGGWASYKCSGSGGIRPALVLPGDSLVGEDGFILNA